MLVDFPHIPPLSGVGGVPARIYMNTSDLQTLNDRFAIAKHLSFQSGSGDLIVAEIKNGLASATVALLGAHVMSFQPDGYDPVLWMSKQRFYEVGKPIRGGIPVCWPWFANHPTDPEKPMHGFVRSALWKVKETTVTDNGATQIRLSICDDESTRTLWPYRFELELVVTVGQELSVERIAKNTGDEAFTYNGALHTYFAVSDVSQITIHGVEGCFYLDNVADFAQKLQQGPIIINSEVDRIYLNTTAECVIADPGLRRQIHVAKTGSRTTVVWNPWMEKSKRMKDFGDQEYPGMVCVETANARDDRITVNPGGEHAVSAIISVEKMN